MKRRLITSLVIAGLLLGLLGGASGWVIGTEAGSRWFIRQAQRWIPGELVIQDVQGRLLDELRLTGWFYRYQDFSFRAASLHLVWRIGLDGVVRVRQLDGDGVEMHIPPFSDEAILLPNVILPLRRLELNQVQFKPMTVQYADKTPFTLDTVVVRAVASDRLAIEYGRVRAPWLQLDMAGTIGLQVPHPLTLNLQWSAPLAEQITLQGQGVLGGTPEHLTLNHTLTRPVALQFTGVLNHILDVARKVNWTAALRWDQFEWPLAPRPDKQAALLISRPGQLHATGTKKDYRLELETDLTGSYLPPGHWRLSAQGDGRGMTIDKLSGELLQGTVNASGQMNWQQPALTAQLKLNATRLALRELWSEWPENWRLGGELLAELNGREVTVKQLEAKVPGTPVKLSLQGRGDFMAAAPTVKTTLQWQALQWPLTGKEPVLTSTQGTLVAEGALRTPQLELDADLAGPIIPKGHWRAAGQLNNNSLQIKRLQADVWQGSLAADGWFKWFFAGEPVLEWQAVVSGTRLNPGKQWPDWPGELSGVVQSQGRWQRGKLETRLATQQIQGRLRGYPLQLQTQLDIQGRHYQLNALDLRSGTARLTGNATLTDTLSANWTIDAPDLANLLPQARGRLTGKGRIGGSLQAPAINASLTGKALVFQDKRLAQLQVEVTSEPAANGTLHLQLNASDGRRGDQLLVNSLQLQGQGRLTDHTLSAAVKMAAATLAMQLKGGFTPAHPFWTSLWQGSLQQLTVNSAESGEWTLANPTGIKFSSTQAQLHGACLQHRFSRTGRTQAETTAQLCTQLDWQTASGARLQAELHDLPLSVGNPWLPPAWSLTGTLAGTASGLLRSDGTLRSEVAIHLTPGLLTTYFEGEMHQLHHQGGELRLTLADTGLTGQVDVKVLDQSAVAVTVNLPRFNRLPISSAQPLQGQLKMTSTELNKLAALLPMVENPRGTIAMDMALEGTLASPRLRGQVRLQQGTLAIPDWGLQLQDVNLTASADGTDTLQLQAGLHSGEGQARLTGALAFPSLSDWRLHARLSGNNLKIADNPTAWILASPDLTLAMEPGAVDVQGTLLIPDAKLTPVISKLSEGAVAVSEDTVLVNPRKPQPVNSNEQKWHSTGQIKLVLADSVTLKIADFKSNLNGSVMITKTPQETIPVGNGRLYIINGKYKAYGQNLEVDKGYVIFANQRIDNPTLDIKAIRRIFGDEPVRVAGIDIGGTLKAPKLSLFSDPPVEEKKILSYLTLGTALGEETHEDKPLGLGGSKTKPYKVGMYVWPNLYVSYGIDTSRQGNNKIYNLRYEFGKQFWIEGEFKEEGNGIDFSYILEH